MYDYAEEASWPIDKAWFGLRGGGYRGRGRLSWKPNTGFHLDAFLDRRGPELPSKIEVGRLGVAGSAGVASVRMRLEGFGRCLSPRIVLHNQLELLLSDRLEIEFPSALFCLSGRGSPVQGWHAGGGLFEIGEGLHLPDTLKEEVRVKDTTIRVTQSRGGIIYEDQSLRLRAWLVSRDQLRMEWSLSANDRSRTNAWRYAEGARDALSFLGGRTVRLLERTVRRGDKEFRQRRRRSDVKSLGLLTMCPSSTHPPALLDKQQIVAVTAFFVRAGPLAAVARQMCAQMAEAASQRTLAAQELLCANVVDAALRTLRGQPYRRSDKTTKIEGCMQQFQREYLGHASWEARCDKVLASYHRLRHRNAHPDWLTQESGGFSLPERQQTLDDMIQIAQFCGYMILAMAGFKDLRPKFPKPHADWGPLLTITSGDGAYGDVRFGCSARNDPPCSPHPDSKKLGCREHQPNHPTVRDAGLAESISNSIDT